MHAEQRSLTHRLVANVSVGVIVRGKRVALVMIQAVAIGGYARHENVAVQIVAAGTRGSFYLSRRGAALPVVHVVIDDIEGFAGQRLLDSVGIVLVDRNARDFLAAVVTRLQG